MSAKDRANRLPGAVESNLARPEQLRIMTVPSSPNSTNQQNASAFRRARRGPASGNSDRLRDFLKHSDARHGTKTQCERFWEKVARTPGCWFWTSAHNRQGYGQFFWRGRAIPAHRIAYALTFGAPPDGALVCHSCDCRPCVNPSHLWVGTQSDNQRDMVHKGRHPEQIAPKQTHCKRGHEYTEANTYHKRDGTRCCNTCMRRPRKRVA